MTLNLNIPALSDTAIKAAIKAGNEILDVYYNSDFGVELKSDKSPLTIADRRAHKVIEELLSLTDIPILSEEGKAVEYSVRKKWELFWMVDPLDGTKEFIKRNDEFTVNIALIYKGTPIAGVVYVPVTKLLYWANEEGAFKAIVGAEDGCLNNIQKLPIESTRDSFIVVGSRSHMSVETELFIQSIDTKGKAIEIKAKGSSLKICMVAEGEADVYPRLAPTMEWDTAAGHAIALYAGKTIYQYENNKAVIYNKENLLNPWFVVN